MTREQIMDARLGDVEQVGETSQNENPDRVYVRESERMDLKEEYPVEVILTLTVKEARQLLGYLNTTLSDR